MILCQSYSAFCINQLKEVKNARVQLGIFIPIGNNAFALNIGKVVGSHTTVAKQLDELAKIDGLKGVMCIFDDFVVGTEDFGRHVMPLLHCR